MYFGIIILIFFLVMSIQRIWETFFKTRKTPGTIINKWSLDILISIHVIIISISIIEYFYMPKSINYIISIVGFFLYFLALLGRHWSSKALGEFHSPHVEIRDNHVLISNGPYKYFRHPYYLSVILEFIGFPLIPNSYIALAVSLFLYIPLLYIFRVFLEEKAMIKKFGPQYIKYINKTIGLYPKKIILSHHC